MNRISANLYALKQAGSWIVLLLGIAATSAAQSVNFSQYLVAPAFSDNRYPLEFSLVRGSDGALWFPATRTTPTPVSEIARISMAGVVTEFPLPVGIAAAFLTPGPDGAIWFSESRKIGRLSMSGALTEFPLPAGVTAASMTFGSDGALWFAGSLAGATIIGRMNTTGSFFQFSFPAGHAAVFEIAAGSDGALWFLESGAKIGRITVSGIVTEFDLPSSVTGNIIAGPDGSLWFTENPSNKLGRITTLGVINEYNIGAVPAGIATGPDGAVWFTMQNRKLGRITTDGVVTEYVLPEYVTFPGNSLAVGSDGALWFNADNNKIVRANVTSGVSSMAQLASGGAWTTTMTLINTGAAPAAVTVNFFDNAGNPLQLPLTFSQGTPVTAATITRSVSALGELIVQTKGPVDQPVQVGWAQVISTGSISGFAVFAQAAGTRVQEAVVPLETRTPGAFVLPFDNITYATGVALANVANQSGSVVVTVRDDRGTVISGPSSITVPARGHMSFVLADQYPVTAQRQGTVEFGVPVNGQISVLGIGANSTGAFTSIPPSAK